MAKPIPEEPLKLYHFRMQPSLVEKFDKHAGKYKRTRLLIELMKEFLKQKEQLAQTINPKK